MRFQELKSFKIDRISDFNVKVKVRGPWILYAIANDIVVPLLKSKLVRVGKNKVMNLINKNIAGKTVADFMPKNNL